MGPFCSFALAPCEEVVEWGYEESGAPWSCASCENIPVSQMGLSGDMFQTIREQPWN